MTKKYILIIAAAFAFQAQACDVSFNTASQVVSKVLRANGWGFQNYEKVCAKLKKANVALVINGEAAVLNGTSIAWATANLKDLNTMVFTNEYGGVSTRYNTHASAETAESILPTAINEAVNSMDIDKAIQSLNESRNKVRQAYSK